MSFVFRSQKSNLLLKTIPVMFMAAFFFGLYHTPLSLPQGHKRGVPGSPSHVAEKLRVTLIEFRSLLDATKVQVGSTKSQLSNLRQNMKQLSTECSTYREIVTSRTNAMTVSV